MRVRRISASLLAAALLPVLAHAAGAANGRKPVASVGLWTQFERRNWAVGYYPGELIQNFNEVDPQVGHTVAEEVALQLDAMKALGIKRITYELRTADAATAPLCGAATYPSCQICFVLGLFWPNPPPQHLANLKAFFDLVASKGVKIDLQLTNTHMEQASKAKSRAWLGAIFDTIKGHRALGLVMFAGDARHIDTNGDGKPDACGGQAEPPLWLGPRSYAANYLKWVIPFAVSRGIPARQLSAEAIIGDFFVDSEPPGGPSATDGHLWKSIRSLKLIFDDLGIAKSQRSYALSFYSQRKCDSARNLPCSPDLPPHEWAEDRVKDALNVIGPTPRRQVFVTEGGTSDPRVWPTERAFESLGHLVGKYRLGGINYWRWTAFEDNEETDPATAKAVKKRGMNYVYFPPQKEIVDLAGYHLIGIPNGSFEAGGARPSLWSIAGAGAATRYRLANEPGQPRLPTRGSFTLRLVTGASANAAIQATSRSIPVDPSRKYTTTGNLRFRWTGDPNPGGAPATRPQVFIAIKYLNAAGQPSAIKPSDTFRFFQADGAADFRTFPVQYATPADAASVKIVVGAARNGLPSKITVDVDHLR
jgi:hypothetical protein